MGWLVTILRGMGGESHCTGDTTETGRQLSWLTLKYICVPKENNLNKCLLRRPICPSIGKSIWEGFCSLNKHTVVCYWTCGCMCLCCVSSQIAGFELGLPVVCQSGEMYSFPYVEIGLSSLWLIEECKNSNIFPGDQLFNITDLDGTFAGSLEIREGKYPSVHLILPREPSWSSFSICCCSY